MVGSITERGMLTTARPARKIAGLVLATAIPPGPAVIRPARQAVELQRAGVGLRLPHPLFFNYIPIV